MAVNQIAVRRSDFAIGTVAVATPRYTGLAETLWNTDDDYSACPYYASGTFTYLSWRTATAPGAGKSVTIRLRVNRVDTDLSVTISDTAVFSENLTSPVMIEEGDLVDFKMTSTGSPAPSFSSFTYLNFEFKGTDSRVSAYTLPLGTLPSTGTLPAAVFLPTNSWGPASARSIVGTPGTITKYSFSTSAAVGSGRSYTFNFVKNGVVQDGSGGTPNTTIALNAGDTEGSWEGSLSIASGDLLQVQCVKVGAAETLLSFGGLKFVASVDGTYQFEGNPVTSLPGLGATNYNDPQGGPTDGWISTEANAALKGSHSSFTVSEMYWRAEGGPSAGTLTLRKNGVATGFTTSISGSGNGLVSAAAVTVADGDALAFEWVSGGGASGGFIRWGFTATALAEPQVRPVSVTEPCCCSCPEDGGGPGPSPSGEVPPVDPDSQTFDFHCSGGGLVPVETSTIVEEVYL